VKEYSWVALKNIVLILVVGFAFYLTRSGWIFLALFFMSSYKPDICPKCGYRFSEESKEDS
jgi:hypothetical protein